MYIPQNRHCRFLTFFSSKPTADRCQLCSIAQLLVSTVDIRVFVRFCRHWNIKAKLHVVHHMSLWQIQYFRHTQTESCVIQLVNNNCSLIIDLSVLISAAKLAFLIINSIFLQCFWKFFSFLQPFILFIETLTPLTTCPLLTNNCYVCQASNGADCT